MTGLPIHSETADAGVLPISESFVSIQGEGKLTGVPSWFVRLAGCNLRCRWCDTPYASWNPEKTVRTIDELVEEAVASGTKHAVLTGGEPMIFKELVPLSRRLADHNFHITIGTELGVDYALTHSCYDPSAEGLACGRCDSCVLRRNGFEQAGIPDPTRYA